MNLVIALLVTRYYLSKDSIRDIVEGYRGQADDAFDRMFERDKEELRSIGINLETGHNEAFFGDEPGYRIERRDFELAEIHLSPEEAAVVGLAARVWDHAGLASDSSAAVLKLKAAGIEVETGQLAMVEPVLSANEPAFDAVWDAVTQRLPVRFLYQRPGAESRERHIEPWGVLNWHGRWYLAGRDVAIDEPRIFRLSRFASEVTPAGPAGSYAIPDGTNLKDLASAMFPPAPTEAAKLRVRSGRGQALRQRADVIESYDEEFDDVTIAYQSIDALASEIASFGTDAIALEPLALRKAVVRRLREVLEA
ncbi:WYL domain-containing protein [soil metagenome]